MSAHFSLPAGACDCHIHVIPDSDRYPFAPERVYTPPAASRQQLLAMHDRVGIERFVIVSPSIYGVDNGVTLDILRELPSRARGVAVIDDSISDAQLDQMAQAGVRGVRINVNVGGGSDPAPFLASLTATARRIARLGWHIQANIALPIIQAVADRLDVLPVMLVLDHFGHPDGGKGVDQPGMRALLGLLESGRSYVKLSAVYQHSSKADYSDMTPFAQACIKANPDRVLWGSNWPHPDLRNVARTPPAQVTPYRVVDNAAIVDLIARWTSDPAVVKALMTDNPARLYGF